MKKVAIKDADGDASQARVFQSLSKPLETTDLAINYFERAPGEPIGYCYHRHHEQEEVFYVCSGKATFETEDGDIRVESGELIRFEPGEWQQGTNREDARLVVLAIGAPREQGPTDLRRRCPSCEKRTPAVSEWTGEEEVFYCEVCGAETGRYA